MTKYFIVRIQPKSKSYNSFQLSIEFNGEMDFYHGLLDHTKQEGMLFTRKKLFFPLNILHQNKYLYQVDQPSAKKTKHKQWPMSDLIQNKTDSIVVESKKDAYEIQKSLDFFLNFLAQEQEKQIKKREAI